MIADGALVVDSDGRLAYSLKELSERLGCSYRFLSDAAELGTLPTFWLGGTRKVAAKTVGRLVAGELHIPAIGRRRKG